jgi:hypothetical protein
MWAVVGRWDNGQSFLYYHVGRTRRDVVKWSEEASGLPWKMLQKRGERAVRVTVSYEVPR